MWHVTVCSVWPAQPCGLLPNCSTLARCTIGGARAAPAVSMLGAVQQTVYCHYHPTFCLPFSACAAAGVCAGLTAMLEAVDELPPSGSPITPAVQTRVRQFFIQQISTANPTAGSSGSVSTGSKPLWVRPKDLQDTKQVRDCL